MPRNEVKVGYSQSKEAWLVVMNDQVESGYDKKQPAEKAGRKLAKSHEPSRFIVQRKNGGVSYEQFYGSEGNRESVF